MSIALITVPYTSSGTTSGEARAPDALRSAGLVEALRHAGVEVVDYGDVHIVPPTPQRDPRSDIIAPDTLAGMVCAVQAAVASAMTEGRRPLVVGGECPLLLGCLAAARDTVGRVGLLFVDGHEDAWPPSASTTGEAADMELGLALGSTRLAGVDDVAVRLPVVQAEDVVLIGPRDRQEIADAGIASLADTVSLLTDTDVQRGDASALGRRWAEQLHASAAGWWFHLDLDVLSSEALAAVRYPQPGGLTWPDLARLTEGALGVPGLLGLNLTIYNPDLDPDGTGAVQIVQFVAAIAPLLDDDHAVRPAADQR